MKVSKLQLMCDEVIENKELEKSIFDIEKQILEMNTPNEWNINVEENMERVLEVDFRKYAIAVKKNVNIDLEKTTVFDFYAAVEFTKDENKPKNQ